MGAFIHYSRHYKVLMSSTDNGRQIAYTSDGALWVLMDRRDAMEGKAGAASGKMTRICLSGSVGGALFGSLKVVVTASDMLLYLPRISLIMISKFQQIAFLMC